MNYIVKDMWKGKRNEERERVEGGRARERERENQDQKCGGKKHRL